MNRSASPGARRPATRRPAPTRRPPTRRGSRRTQPERRQWGLIATAVVGVLGLVGAFLYLALREPPTEQTHLWIVEKTTAAPAVLPDPLRDALDAAAEEGVGTLITYPVGAGAVKLDAVRLRVERNGQILKNPQQRAVALQRRLDEIRGHINEAPVGAKGFSLYAAFQAMADEAKAGPLEVWFSTTLLTGSVDPFDIPALTSSDPQLGVAEVLEGPMNRLRLDGVTLHPLLLVPVGPDQKPLTAADEAWRADFVRELGTSLGARVEDPLRVVSTEPPWAAPSVVAPVEPLVDPTPLLPCSGERCVIDNLSFVINTPRLIDSEAARQRVASFVAQLPRPLIKQIVVSGYTARYGDAGLSRELGRQRAETVAALLKGEGVADADLRIDGVGYDRQADPSQSPQSQAQRVVILTLEDRR